MEIDLLILVSSAVSHVDQREAIRSTWASPDHLADLKTKVIFLLGNDGEVDQAAIRHESKARRDILQEDFKVRNSLSPV